MILIWTDGYAQEGDQIDRILDEVEDLGYDIPFNPIFPVNFFLLSWKGGRGRKGSSGRLLVGEPSSSEVYRCRKTDILKQYGMERPPDLVAIPCTLQAVPHIEEDDFKRLCERIDNLGYNVMGIANPLGENSVIYSSKD